MELTLDLIKDLTALLVEHKLDKLKVGDFEICKSRHENTKTAEIPTKLTNSLPLLDEDELLFHSTSSPSSISKEEINPYLSPKLRNK